MKISNKHTLYLSIYAFCVIFCPPIVPRFDIVLIGFSGMMIFFKYRSRFISAVFKSGIATWVKLMVGLACYVALIPLPLSAFFYNDVVQVGHYISLVNRYGLMTVAVIVCGSYFFMELQRNEYDFSGFLKVIFYAGAIESTCCVLSLMFPRVKNLFVSLMLANTGSELYQNTWYITVRAYGFSNTLVDLFGLGISVIASSCLLYGVFKEKKFIFLSIYISIATALNSRTGLLIYLLCACLVVIYMMFTGSLKKFLVGVMVLALAVSGFNILMNSNILDEATKGWIEAGFESVYDLIETGKAESDSLGVLFQDSWWELPKGIRLLFGTGHSRYGANGYTHTDVGYVNEIWLFGVIGVCVLYISIAFLIWKYSFKRKDRLVNCIGIILFVEYFAFNVKAVALGYNPGAMSILLILFGIKFFFEKKEKGRKGSVQI